MEEYGDCEAVNMLKECKKFGKPVPNFLLYGSQGLGKSTFANLMKQFIFDPRNVFESNASFERGIGSIRNHLSTFINRKNDSAQRKLVIMDEADNLTADAQAGLKGIIENPKFVSDESKITFCLICNNETKIIPEIQSRLNCYLFKPFDKETLISKLKTILIKEKRNPISSEALETIYELSNGDLRNAINNLQLFVTLNLSIQELYELSATPSVELIKELFLLRKDIFKVCEYLQDLIYRGYSPKNILSQIVKYVKMDTSNVDHSEMIQIIQTIPDIENNLEIATPAIQLSKIFLKP